MKVEHGEGHEELEEEVGEPGEQDRRKLKRANDSFHRDG